MTARRTRWSPPIYPAIFVVGVVTAVTAARGRAGLLSLSYDYAHQALLAAAGRITEALTQFPKWPPGFALFATPFVWLGLTPTRAEWILSVLAFGLTVSLTFAIGYRLVHWVVGVAAAVVVMLNPTVLDWANMAMSEMLFTASILTAVIVFDEFYLAWVQSDAPTAGRAHHRLLALAIGLTLCLPFWLRYIGVVIPLIGLACLALMFARAPCHRWRVIAAATFTGALLLLLPLRNWLITGGPTGHDVGVASAVTFLDALRQVLRGIRLMWLYFMERFPRDPVDLVTALALLAAAVIYGRKIRRVLAAWVPIAYLVTLAGAASHTRIDRIGDRFITPIFPLLVLALCGAIYEVVQWTRRERRPWPRRGFEAAVVLLSLPLVAVSTLSVARGIGVVVGGFTPENGYWSPETLAFIEKTVPMGSVVAVSRYGGQLAATSLHYHVLSMPFDDPTNDDYTRAYGVVPWTRAAALRTFVQMGVRYVVFFLGRARPEPYLERGWYGSYVGSLVSASLPEVADMTILADGIVVTLSPKNRLIEMLSREYQDDRTTCRGLDLLAVAGPAPVPAEPRQDSPACESGRPEAPRDRLRPPWTERAE